MAVFNSLGSNYSFRLILESLIGFSFKLGRKRIADELAEHYGGRTTLTFKGRQALELALRRSGLPKGSKVAVNGFTCYVVYKAVADAGYEPVFLDVAEGQLNFGPDELKAACEKDGNLRAVIVQNTLGYPCDLPAIAAFCQTNELLLIEDLAHSLGVVYADGREAGAVGDMAMLSFSQDKPLDVVAGGALIDRRKENSDSDDFPEAALWLKFKNRMYPFWTWLIRAAYPAGLGRYIHALLKKLRLLATPMNDSLQGIQAMTGKAAVLLLSRWHARGSEIAHRRKIAAIYQAALPPEIQFAPLSGSQPLFLRFAIAAADRKGLISQLKQSGIYLGDTWYDAPVAPARYLKATAYKTGECPNAEKLAGEIVNLPTHINVSENQAADIAEKVSQWLKSR